VGLNACGLAPEYLLCNVSIEAAVNDCLDAVCREAVAVFLVRVVLVDDDGIDALYILENLAPDGVGVDAACVVNGFVVAVSVILVRLPGAAALKRRGIADVCDSFRDAGVYDGRDGFLLYVAVCACYGGLRR